jgi:hypothetical protein
VRVGTRFEIHEELKLTVELLYPSLKSDSMTQ